MGLLKRRIVGGSAIRIKSLTKPDSLHAAATRDQILTVAAEAFARNGYVATTLDQIADQLGFTKPSLYYYFSSKQAILAALFDQMVSQYFAGAQRIAQSDLPPVDKLRRLFDEHIDFVINRTAWTVVFTNDEIHLHDEKRVTVRRRRRKYDQLLQNIYEEGVRTKAFKETNSYAVIAGLVGLATSLSVWYRRGGDITPSEVKEIYWNLISRGFLVDKSPHGARFG